METKRVWTNPMTENDMIEKFDIDTKRWQANHLKTNTRQSQQKTDNWPIIVDLYQTLVDWKPKHPLLDEWYYEAMVDVFGDKLPQFETIHTPSQWDLLALLIHTDKHIDRLEHNHRYMQNVKDRTNDLLYQIQKRDIEKFVYGELWDMFNSNTNGNTKNWTRQNNNATEAQSFKVGMMNEIDLIGMMNEVFGSVEAIYVPWNHDQDKQNWLAQALNLYFTNHPHISIDDQDKMRKYIDYGKNVIGLQHWHLVPRNRALETFSSEHKMRDHNYLLQWHIHHEYAKQYGKLLVQALGSTAKPSQRERENWYNNEGNMVAMIFDKKKGRIATLEG